MAVFTETLPLPQLNFHPGEVAVQELVGVREHVVSSGYNAFIRPYMPEQHRDFFNNQHLFYISGRDVAGKVWVSVLPGQPGFVSSPDERHLLITPITLHPEDPVASCLKVGAQLGALGIELPTRRRNRVNVTVLDVTRSPAQGHAASSMLVKVDTSYGNCPKYIQARELELDYAQLPMPSVEKGGPHLGPAQQQLVRNADTIFVGSCYYGPVPTGTNPQTIGCDCSHRGGPPGFVQVQADASGSQPTQLTWADYRGNNFYQTLGNIMSNAAAGLLIIDFSTGDMLQITGHASVKLKDTSLPGALHTVTLEVMSYIHTHNALPLKQVGATKFSPFLPAPVQPQLASNTLPAAATRAAASSTAEAVEVVSVTQAARDIKTFELRLPARKWDQQPGQYATFEFMPETLKASQLTGSSGSGEAGSAMLRTWTISSHPHASALSKTFTITVKKVGLVTTWMHQHLKAGMKLHLRDVGGEFDAQLYCTSPPAKVLATVSAVKAVTTLDADVDSNSVAVLQAEGVLMLAGGIGITPMWPILYEFTQPRMDRITPPAAQPAFVVLVYSVRSLQDAALLPQIASVLEQQQQWPQYAQKDVGHVMTRDSPPTPHSTRQLSLESADSCGAIMPPYVHVVLSVTGQGTEAHKLMDAMDPALLKHVHVNKGRVSQQMVAEHVQAASSTVNSLSCASAPPSGVSAPFDSIRAAYACGPPGFMASVEALLGAAELGFDVSKRLHTESFNF